MIARAATASETMSLVSFSTESAGAEYCESGSDPLATAPEEVSRMVLAAVRIDDKSFRAINSFQAGS